MDMSTSQNASPVIAETVFGKTKQVFKLLFRRPFSYIGCYIASMLVGLLAMAMILVPFSLIDAEGVRQFVLLFFSAGNAVPDEMSVLVVVSLCVAVFIFSCSIGIVLFTPQLTVARQQLDGEKGGFRAVFGYVFKRFFPLLKAVLICLVLYFIGLILFVVPFFYLICRFALVVPLVAFDNHGVKEAFQRSSQLMQGRKWNFFLVTLLTGIILGIIAFVLVLILTFVFLLGTSPEGEIGAVAYTISYVFEVVADAISYAGFSITSYLFYKEAKITGVLENK